MSASGARSGWSWRMRSARLGRNVSSDTRSRRGRSLPLMAQTALLAFRSAAAGALAPVSIWAMRQLLGRTIGLPLLLRQGICARKRGLALIRARPSVVRAVDNLARREPLARSGLVDQRNHA